MTKIKDLEWFCPQPFMNTVINHDKIAKPCCVLKDGLVENLETLVKLLLWTFITQTS